ncbi:MAG: hypothetical protein Q7V57_03920 [Actinomycetota bacterium]|nr:hypothetical protein [Actinomycetota bacterium]
MKVGRLIGACALGFFFFLFVAIDLVLFGVIPLNSVLVTLLPLIGLLLVAVIGVVSSRGGGAAPAEQPPAPPAPAA